MVAPRLDVSRIEQPPTTLLGILRRLGPGLIIAGSIVGSGELIATTKTGAEAGFWLLWLILIGCVIKVFVQVEIGRYTLVSGNTIMDGLDEVPGPRLPRHGNWLVWFWMLVFVATIGQQGGIVGGVGQALQICVPLTENGRKYNAQVDAVTRFKVAQAELRMARDGQQADRPSGGQRIGQLEDEVERLGETIIQMRLEAAREQIGAKQQVRDDDAELTALREALAIAVTRFEAGQLRPENVFATEGPDVAGQSQGVRDALVNLGIRDSFDDEWWAIAMATLTAVLLVVGRYGLIQSFATAMVASFTLITILNLIMLQSTEVWAVTPENLAQGLSFRLPPPPPGASRVLGVTTALATFGIIGVGANELIAYPYWCLEKGYARFTGPRDASREWAERAKGWMRVMRWDAWCSMVVYTFATVTFYLLGAAILWRSGLNPEGSAMIRTLGVMYEPVFGSIARWIFLFGAFAVLYSTLFVAAAGLARSVPDAIRKLGFGPRNEVEYRRWVRAFGGIFPFVCVIIYCALPAPAELVLLSGIMQGVMLPMLAAAALYFRYRRCDARIAPGGFWDLLLWLSAGGMLVTGLWTCWSKLSDLLL
jgi:Mn2+/Fe2+ NRAMP family transporter